MTPQPLQCDDVTCYSTVLFELQELLNYINPDSPAGKIIARRYNELWELRKGCVSHSSRPAPASAPEDAFAFMRNDQIKKWQDRQICPHSWVRKNGKYRCFASYMGWDCPMICNDDVRCEVYE